MTITSITHCRFYHTCKHKETCEHVLTDEEYHRLVNSNTLFALYVAKPMCFELHSTPDLDDEEDFDDE